MGGVACAATLRAASGHPKLTICNAGTLLRTACARGESVPGLLPAHSSAATSAAPHEPSCGVRRWQEPVEPTPSLSQWLIIVLLTTCQPDALRVDRHGQSTPLMLQRTINKQPWWTSWICSIDVSVCALVVYRTHCIACMRACARLAALRAPRRAASAAAVKLQKCHSAPNNAMYVCPPCLCHGRAAVVFIEG